MVRTKIPTVRTKVPMLWKKLPHPKQNSHTQEKFQKFSINLDKIRKIQIKSGKFK